MFIKSWRRRCRPKVRLFRENRISHAKSQQPEILTHQTTRPLPPRGLTCSPRSIRSTTNGMTRRNKWKSKSRRLTRREKPGTVGYLTQVKSQTQGLPEVKRESSKFKPKDKKSLTQIQIKSNLLNSKLKTNRYKNRNPKSPHRNQRSTLQHHFNKSRWKRLHSRSPCRADHRQIFSS